MEQTLPEAVYAYALPPADEETVIPLRKVCHPLYLAEAVRLPRSLVRLHPVHAGSARVEIEK